MLGQTSRLFESGRGGAGTVSTGRGDFGGVSYGAYQLSSSAGTLQRFLKTSRYGEQFEGLRPGTPEFNARWRELAKNDPSFGEAQHAFIRASHFDPAMSGLKNAGIDLTQHGPAVQEAMWSTAVQFGAGSARRGTGAIGMFQKSLAGQDVASMSDRDIVTALQNYKLANNDRLFRSSSEQVRAGTARRAMDEKRSLWALADRYPAPVGATAPAAPVVARAPALAVAPVGIAAPAAPVVASVRVPNAPSASAAPSFAEAPAVAVPMSGGTTRSPVTVVSAPTEVGQDVRERGIAHIATGGLSAS